MYIDAGGVEQEVTIRVLNCGLGILTLLDGAKDGNKALVRLDAEGDYYDPKIGEPQAIEFIDPIGANENKLFGQGAELRCKNFCIYYN
jgi:hypothetical protein